MEETEPEKKLSKPNSSINRKPLLNLTNIVRKPYKTSSLSQSKRPAGSSTASDSSIGSTQNPNHVPASQSHSSTHPRLTADHLVGCENRIPYAQRESTLKTRSKTKADVPFYQTSVEEIWSNGKIKDQGKGNPSSLDKMMNNGKEISLVLHSPSMKKIVDKRKAINVPLSSCHTSAKNSIDTLVPHSTLEIKDKGKESVLQCSNSSTGNTKHNVAITMLKRNNKGKVDVSKYQTTVKETRRNGKEGFVPLCSSTLEKTKDQVKGNQSSLNKTTDDGKEIFVAHHFSAMEKIKNKRKAIDVPFSAHQTKNAKNNMDSPFPHSTLNIKDQRKEDAVAGRSSYPPVNTNSNMTSTLPQSLMKGMDKGKGIAVPLDCNKMVEVRAPLSGVHIRERGEAVAGTAGFSHVGLSQKDKGKAVATPVNYHSLETENAMPLSCPPTKNVKNNMAEVCGPLSVVNIKDKGETVSGSSRVDLAQKDEGKDVATPINYRILEKKDKGTSCPPILRNTYNRYEADGARHASDIKVQSEPPNKKKRCLSSKGGAKKYALPQDFVEQQRAYFKEIDDFELEVEEV